MLIVLRSMAARIGPWPRRVAAAACLLLALTSALGGRSSARNVPVLVSTRDLSAGARLVDSDVTVRRLPAAWVPSGHVDLRSAAIGHRLIAAAGAGEILTRRMLDSAITEQLAADEVAITVTMADDVGALVHPGDSVDLLAAPSGSPGDPANTGTASGSSAAGTAVATGVRVLAVLGPGGPDGPTRSSLIVGTDRGTAARIAAASGSTLTAVVGRSP